MFYFLPSCSAWEGSVTTFPGQFSRTESHTVPQKIVGDHLFPTSRQGREGLPNYLALCRSHNAGKSNKDLVEWLVSKGWPFDQGPVGVW